ncbi:MAG: LDCC motif putative metal-binding protein [Sphaerochaetaceae bacterium]|nr:LDCC motif putative metal-binding protein [Sphaerochaeta sp.]
MHMLESLKQRWNNYIKKLGEANAHNFGDQKLDCCSLNRKDQPESQPDTTVRKEDPHG